MSICKFDIGVTTDIGRRKQENEDEFAIYDAKGEEVFPRGDVGLFAVADGLGGHVGGKVASKLAVKILRDFFEVKRPEGQNPLPALVETIRKANTEVFKTNQQMLPGQIGMGTTMASAFIENGTAYFCNVGDSRGYILRGDVLEQVTTDHSWVDEQVALGQMTEEEAKKDKRRHLITRSIGTRAEVEVDTFERELEHGDRILLCSDGASNMVSDDEIKSILLEANSAQEATDRIVRVGNEHGGSDNLTALLIWTDKSLSKALAGRIKHDTHRTEQTKPSRLWLILTLLCALAIGFVLGKFT